jgi:L-galactose dehydrogenase
LTQSPDATLLFQVGRYGADKFDFSAQRVTDSVTESLTRLQLSYIDIIQCHDIEFGDLDQASAGLHASKQAYAHMYT